MAVEEIEGKPGEDDDVPTASEVVGDDKLLCENDRDKGDALVSFADVLVDVVDKDVLEETTNILSASSQPQDPS